MEDVKEAVVTISGKDSDKFGSHYKGYTGWFILYHEFKKRKFSTLEPDFYKNIYEQDIEGLVSTLLMELIDSGGIN